MTAASRVMMRAVAWRSAAISWAVMSPAAEVFAQGGGDVSAYFVGEVGQNQVGHEGLRIQIGRL